MSDNLADRGPRDRTRVNVNEDWELRYWSKELGATPEQLREAVDQVGTSVDKVREHVQKMVGRP